MFFLKVLSVNIHEYTVRTVLTLLKTFFTHTKEMRAGGRHKQMLSKTHCCGSGSWIRCLFDPRIANPYLWVLTNSYKLANIFFSVPVQKLNNLNFVIFVASKKGRTTNFFSPPLWFCSYWIRNPDSEIRGPGSGFRDPRSGFRDPGSEIRDPEWIKIRIRNTSKRTLIVKNMEPFQVF